MEKRNTRAATKAKKSVQEESLPQLNPASPATVLARKLARLSLAGRETLGGIDFFHTSPPPSQKKIPLLLPGIFPINNSYE